MKTHRIAQTTRVSGRTVRDWRKAHNLSAAQLAARLGYKSRGYVKSIESGYYWASARFTERFKALREEMGESRGEAVTRERVIVSDFALPAGQIALLAKPRRCAFCKMHFVPVNAQQRYCRESCRTLAAKRARTRGRR